MLGLMIHAHPRLAMPPESRFLVRIWRQRHLYGDLQTEEERTALAADITGAGTQILDLGLRKDSVREAIGNAPPTLGSAIGTVFQEYAKAQGKPRWGDKRPTYFREVAVLRRLFPDAQFIHLIRDGRAAVASLNRMPWFRYSNIHAMAMWSEAEWCMRRDAKELPADTLHTMRYESLVADPRPVLEEMCAFLGEDFHEAMLEPDKVNDVIPERKVWHEALKQGVRQDRVDSWRIELEPWELGLMETVVRRKLRRNGYETSGVGTRPSVAALRRYAFIARRNRYNLRKRWTEEARDAANEVYPVAAQLTSRQRELVVAG
jgi:hypothetical protein